MKKHLTLSDRIIIEQKLNEGTSIREIARTVNKDASTIIREINKRKCPKGKRSIKVLPACANKHDCQVTGLCKDKRCYMLCRNCMACKSLCELYVPGTCTKLEKSPYVCNGCDKQGSCTYDRFFYIATYANDLYQDTLISSREGINQEPEKIREMDELISPLIKKASPYHISTIHIQEHLDALNQHFTTTSIRAFSQHETLISLEKLNIRFEKQVQGQVYPKMNVYSLKNVIMKNSRSI